MNVIDTLYFIFKGDTTQLQKSEADAKKSTDELEKSLKQVDDTSNKFASSFQGVISSLTSYVAAIASAATIIHEFKKATEYSEELYRSSKALNVNAEQLDLWSRAVEVSGGNAHDLEGTLKNLSSRFGVTAQGALRSLPAIADLIQRMGNFRGRRLAESLGINEGTLLLLQQGSRGIKDIMNQQRALGVVTKEQTEIAFKYYRAWDNLRIAFRTIFVDLSSFLLPAFTRAIDGVVDTFVFFRVHKDLFIGGLVGIATVLSFSVIPALARAAVASWAFMAPMLPMIALMIAVGGAVTLVTEDILTFIQGGKSLTGLFISWVEQQPKLMRFFHAIQDVVKDTVGVILSIVDAIKYVVTHLPQVNENLKEYARSLRPPEQLQQAQNTLALATNNIFTSRPAASAGDVLNTRALSVNIDNITINSQATDASQIVADLNTDLFQKHFYQAANFYSTGVAG